MEETIRTEMLIGQANVEKLHNSCVAVFGIGGVGSFCVEALARVGIGKIILVDNDVVAVSNINRQLIALHSTVGKAKVEVMKDRIYDINPNCEVLALQQFYTKEHEVDISNCDYVVDAIDTVTSKIELICEAKENNVPIISSMGTGNKLYTNFEITDISKTSVCPLARVMRYELRKRNIKNVKVLYSKEEPKKTGSNTPASISYVPSVAGLMIAGEVVRDILTTD